MCTLFHFQLKALAYEYFPDLVSIGRNMLYRTVVVESLHHGFLTDTSAAQDMKRGRAI
jgi:hypothetical protein